MREENRKKGRREGELFGKEGEAAETLPQNGNVEVDQERGRQTSEAQVGESLRMVHGKQLLNGLHLDDEFARNNEIQAVGTWQTEPFVVERKRALPLKINATQRKLVGETGFVGRFE